MEWFQLRDLLALSAMIVVVLVPVVGLTARFTIGPLIDRFARLRSAAAEDTRRQLDRVTRETALLRERVDGLESDLHRVREGREFDRQLRSAPAEEQP
jgi:hypothetical protein